MVYNKASFAQYINRVTNQHSFQSSKKWEAGIGFQVRFDFDKRISELSSREKEKFQLKSLQ